MPLHKRTQLWKKQEELEATVILENQDMVAIAETWWDDFHNWSTASDGYKLFRRDRQRRREGDTYLNQERSRMWSDYSLRTAQVERLQVGVRDQGNKANLVTGIYFSLPDQAKPLNEVFYFQLQEALESQALILLGDPHICWQSIAAICRQCRRVSECTKNNFLTRVIDVPDRTKAILDLSLTNANEPLFDTRIEGRLGCMIMLWWIHALEGYETVRE